MGTELPTWFELGDMTVHYPADPAGSAVGLWIWPTEKSALPSGDKRRALAEEPDVTAVLPWGMPAWRVDSLVHVHRRGDGPSSPYANGRTLRDSETTRGLRLVEQRVDSAASTMSIVTELADASELHCTQRLSHREGDGFLRVQTSVENRSPEAITLDMVTSFSLGGLSPFALDDAPDRFVFHRFRSTWSAEGRHTTDTIYDLHLERSWIGMNQVSERFGQVGSMPVRGFFPTAAVEDREAGVLWGAQLACNGSWQMELARADDLVNLSGGLADRELGHWAKTLAPGEAFSAPEAVLSCVAGDIDALCQRLTSAQKAAADTQPEIERSLPICFNEWCTSWGTPSHESLVALADRLEGSGITYLVIDAGWYVGLDGSVNWMASHGDWRLNGDRFPDGLRATADEIRKRGLIPGLWFEMETVGDESESFAAEVDHLLQRDGVPLTVGRRRFWDLRDPEAHRLLEERVIDTLREGGFGYCKIDYNDAIGLGVDGAESPGEGLRQHLDGTSRLFRRMRERLPDLVIENCASGGHRLEPSMQALTAMGSFSDAHEGLEVPLIAANLQRLILPRQSLVWAVLRASDTPERIVYSMAATFLGRVCLSGNVTDLDDEQWSLVRAALDLYPSVAPIIRDGRSKIYGTPQRSYRRPTGWQGVVRTSADESQALVVAHAFADPQADAAVLPLPQGAGWSVKASYAADDTEVELEESGLTCPIRAPFAARIVWLTRNDEFKVSLVQ